MLCLVEDGASGDDELYRQTALCDPEQSPEKMKTSDCKQTKPRFFTAWKTLPVVKEHEWSAALVVGPA